MAAVVLATIDAAHAPILAEALDGAGIAARMVPVKPSQQFAYLRNQQRPMIDVEVDATDESEARRVMAQMTREAEEAAQSQSHGDEYGGKSADDVRMESAPDQLRSPLFATLLALALPVAGPAYAGSIGPATLSLLAHLVVCIALLPCADAEMACSAKSYLPLLVVRLIDVIASPLIARRNNRRSVLTANANAHTTIKDKE